MTDTQIKKDLEKIYKIRRSRSGAKGPFTEEIIRERGIVLFAQNILENLLSTKNLKTQIKRSFYSELYGVIKDRIKKQL